MATQSRGHSTRQFNSSGLVMRRWLRLLPFGLFGLAGWSIIIWIAIFCCTSYWVPESAIETARNAAAERGYQMEGSYSQFIGGPSMFGQCDAKVAFGDVAVPSQKRRISVRLHRDNFFSEWHVVELTEVTN
jgi:hypothetical protein